MNNFDQALLVLEQSCGLEKLRIEDTETAVHLLCRVRSFDRLRELLKPAMQVEGAVVDLSKIYFLKEGEWVFLFRISISGNVEGVVDAIVNTVPASGGKIMSGPILGGRVGLGQNSKGAGVMPFGQAKLGRALL